MLTIQKTFLRVGWVVIATLLGCAPHFVVWAARPLRDAPRVLEKFRVHFPQPALTNRWQHVVFTPTKHPNQFAEVCVDGKNSLQITSKSGGSGLVWLHAFNPQRTPWLRWEWKVSNMLPKSDLRTKEGDDTPIRMMILFPQSQKNATWLDRLAFQRLKSEGRHFPGEAIPHAVLTYVWSRQIPLHKVMVSPYAERVRLIALDRGKHHVGKWRMHQQNLARDYKKAYHQPLPSRVMLAIAADADNTLGSFTSWVANVKFSKEKSTVQKPPKKACASR